MPTPLNPQNQSSRINSIPPGTNPFDQFDSLPPEEPEPPSVISLYGRDATILVIALLIAVGGYKLWKKVLAGHTGWTRAAKAITALSLLLSTGVFLIDAPRYSHYGSSEWASVLLTVIVINAVFWTVLWVAKGFNGQ